eukprot:jgi/Chrzof1/5719/Cz16g12280.t1
MDPNEACALALKIAAGVATPPPLVDTLLTELASAKAANHYIPLALQVHAFFSNPDAVHAAFWSKAPPAPNKQQHASSRSSASLPVDMDALHELQTALFATKSKEVNDAFAAAADGLLSHVASTSGRDAPNPGLPRQVAVLLTNPLLEDIEYLQHTARLAKCLVTLRPKLQKELMAMFASWTARDMHRVIIMLQQFITLTLYNEQAITEPVENATKLLGLLSMANEQSGAVELSEFYNDAVNNEDFNVKEDFRRWKNPSNYRFSFCHYPFVYDPASKARILQLENMMAQYQEFGNSIRRAMMGGNACPYLILKVRRGPYLLQDTLVQINRAKDNDSLRKSLKVKFVGEEGVDEGGVQKEFFQLLVRQCFNPDFGMFSYDEVRHLHWFRPSRLDMEMEFELIGILIGLAIYNSHILEFQFPMVLYKKLMGQQIGLADLAELHPDVHASLTKLLDMSGEQLEALNLAFQVESEMSFGEIESVDLLPNGASVAVTAANKAEYVKLYVAHLLEGSVDRQFGAFQKGFLRLCSGAALQFFRPAELEQLVCGGQLLDLEALEANTIYEDGYTPSHQVITWFWQVVHALDDAQKKRLLFFITGSDRVPIKGLSHLSPPFVISKNGPHMERLPTAHTCFNHLLLPAYKDKETLQRLLLLAIENAEGFGLM